MPPAEMTPELQEKLRQVAVASGSGEKDKEDIGAMQQQQVYFKVRERPITRSYMICFAIFGQD